MSKKKIVLTPATKISVRIADGKKLVFSDEDILGFCESKVSIFGNSAKINFTKDYANAKVYVVICR